MLPLSDGIPARRLPIVNVAIIVANFAVWLFHEIRTCKPRCFTRRSTPTRSTTRVTDPSLGR